MTSTPVTPQPKEQELSEKIEKLAAWLDFQLGEPVGNQVRAIGSAVRERDDQLDAIWDVVRYYLPQAIGFNTLPEIVAGIARQRDAQHEIKDHLADTARNLTTERERLRRELQQAQQQLSDENAKRLAAESRIAAVEQACGDYKPNTSAWRSAYYPGWLDAMTHVRAAVVATACDHGLLGEACRSTFNGSAEHCPGPVVATPAEPQQEPERGECIDCGGEVRVGQIGVYQNCDGEPYHGTCPTPVCEHYGTGPDECAEC